MNMSGIDNFEFDYFRVPAGCMDVALFYGMNSSHLFVGCVGELGARVLFSCVYFLMAGLNMCLTRGSVDG